MPAWNSIESVVTGRVRSVNEKGLKLEGHDGWFNISKFAVGVELPEKGAHVAVHARQGGLCPRGRISQPFSSRRRHSDGPLSPQPAAPSARDRTITRLAILKAAAEFGAARPNLKSGPHVLCHRRDPGSAG